MTRQVQPELLDQLPATDPGAVKSRRDLRRLNWWMGNAWIMAGALRSFLTHPRPMRLAELGAGDGDLLARVARRLGAGWRGTRATLLDQQNLLSTKTAGIFREVGWEVETVNREILDWSAEEPLHSFDAVVTNLFLHHFDEKRLSKLLLQIARCTPFFVALEPRRSRLALTFSHLVGLIGCNDVTRHDAPVSVRAGFSTDELSRLWPAVDRWRMDERRAGAFGHLFIARAIPGSPT